MYLALKIDEQHLELHEKALEADPHNEELFKRTFYAVVRVKDYKKQYQLATKYYKLFKNPKYSFWAVMSLLLQGNSEAGDPKLFYQLARRIASKADEDGSIKTLEGSVEFTKELHLYIATLLEQEDYKAAAEVVSGPYKSLFSNQVERTMLLCELNKKLLDWEPIAMACRDILLSKE
jgi:N-terminal acetyltransferase B complex non-catalytic subunit